MTDIIKMTPFEELRKLVPKQYRNEGLRFLDYLQKTGSRLEDPSSWHQYAESLQETQTDGRMKGQEYAVSSQAKMIQGMIKVIRLIAELDLNIDQITMAMIDREINKIERPKPDDPHPVWLTPQEVWKLIREIPDPADPVSEDIALMVEFLFATGLRISELLRLTLGRIKQYNEKWFRTQVRAKGRKQHTVNIPAGLYFRVRHRFKGRIYLFEKRGLPEDAKPQDLQFKPAFVSMRILRYSRKILGKDATAHTLRHSIATHLYHRCHDVVKVADFLGHSKPSTTSNMYLHGHVELDEIEDAIESSLQPVA